MRRPRQARLEFVNVVMKAPGRLGRNRDTATWGRARSGTKSQRNGRRRRQTQVGREDARQEAKATYARKAAPESQHRGHSGGTYAAFSFEGTGAWQGVKSAPAGEAFKIS